MSNRGSLIVSFSFFLALVGPASAQSPLLQVQVYDYAGLQPAALRQFVTRTEDILAGAGLSIQVKLCERRVEPSCENLSGDFRRLVIRVVAGEAKSMRNTRRLPLGQSFADHDGGTYASIFLAPVQDQAAEANVPWVTVLAYAAAHEIGHLLLGKQAHTPRGLMKANWDRNDYEGMNQNRCHFSPEQIRELEHRYGTPSQAHPGTDAALARVR